jgi:hypothetical protein
MMKASWRARMREGALSLFALAALLSILFVIDFRVRDEAARAVAATSPSSIAQTRAHLSASASQVVANIRDQGMEHVPLAGFIGIAGVLLLFMLKT